MPAHGDDVDDVFPVKIHREADVADLKDALKLKRSTAFMDVNAANLKLYSLLVPSGVDHSDELGKWRLRGKMPLRPTQKLSSAFPRTQEGLWVVVVIHPTTRTQFQVYFKGQIVPVSGVAHSTVRIFLSSLLCDQQHGAVFKDVSASQVKVYRLNPPVLGTEEGNFLEHLKPMKGSDTVELSFGESTVTREHVFLALMLAEDDY